MSRGDAILRVRAAAALAAHEPRELPPGDFRLSGVMALFHEVDGVEHLLFQVRTHTVRHHKGEISFPGGRHDRGDADLLETALRETEEEIGVDRGEIELLGQLDDTRTRASNYLIRPYVGALPRGRDFEFAHAPREVKELLQVPVPHLLSAEAAAWQVVEENGEPVPTRAFMYGEHLIWGATARIVSQLVDLVAAQPVEASR